MSRGSGGAASRSGAKTAKTARVSRQMAAVGLVAMAIGSLIALRTLSDTGGDGDITFFAAFGEDATATREYAEERLGEVSLRPFQGHDGKFFFVQANDPWLLNPIENAQVLDRPLYRSQRMLYPVLAGGGGLLGPDAVIWAMLIVNLIALGVGSWAVAALAVEMGGSPWWGLAFVLNIGFISEMSIGGSGILSAALAFWGVVFLLRGRFPVAVVFLVFGALAREAMLIAAAGSAWFMWRQGRRRDAALVLGTPIAAVGTWALYLQLRIGLGSDSGGVLGFPFVGFVRAFEGWLGDPVDLAVGVTMMLLFVLYTRRALMVSSLLSWTFLGFVPIAALFTEQVWRNYFDISRAVAPLFTAFVLMVFLGAPINRTLRNVTKEHGK